MFKQFKDDAQVFMLVVSTRSHSPPEDGASLASVVIGSITFAIVMMVFVGLVQEAEQRRLYQPVVQPNYSRQVR